jgi:hypothetical protein
MMSLCAAAVTILGLLAPSQPPDAAEARLDALLQAMGGRAAWAAAQAVKVDATHYSTVFRLPHRNEIWNDFRTPRLRIVASSEEIDRALVVDGNRGSRRNQADVRALTAEEVTEQLRWWESNVYRTLHRLARRDSDLAVRMIGAHRLAVFRKDGVRLNWIDLNQLSEPILFGSWDSETGTIFGPLTASPSGLKHPRWVASGDGTWRVELRELQVIDRVDVDDKKL